MKKTTEKASTITIGRYYAKAKVEAFTVTGKAVKSEIMTRFEPASFKDHLDVIEKFAKAILIKNGSPTSWAEKPSRKGTLGGRRICIYPEETLACHEASAGEIEPGSAPAVASQIVARITRIRSSRASEILIFELGGLFNHLRFLLQFDEVKKRDRADKLSKAMQKTMITFFKINGRLPGARELWNELPVDENGTIYDRDNDCIDWKSSSGMLKSTKFKTFQNRYSRLKKNQKK